MVWWFVMGSKPSPIKEFLLSIEAFIVPYLYAVCRLVFGTLYPAYASYKAVRTKNVKEYVKWMMYWIIFALFTCVETFSDMFIAWVPFYYELKIAFVLWLLSPVTKGSSYLYRKFVHPSFSKREKEIDEYIAKASDKGYTTLISLGSKGITYATNVVLQTAIKGQSKLADQIRKSYSLNDIATSSSAGDAVDIIDGSEDDSEEEFKATIDNTESSECNDKHTEQDRRLAEDNRELEHKRDQQKRRKRVQRSSSSAAALYSLSEEESEPHVTKERTTHKTMRQEPRYSTRSAFSNTEQKQIDTYGTMPRKRVKKRPSLKQMKETAE